MMNLNEMSHEELVDYIVDYYNEHFKWQKLVMDKYIDRDLVNSMSNEELKDFITNNCK